MDVERQLFAREHFLLPYSHVGAVYCIEYQGIQFIMHKGSKDNWMRII